MPMLKVLKFGGSSMASAAQYRKIKAIVEQDSSRDRPPLEAAAMSRAYLKQEFGI